MLTISIEIVHRLIRQAEAYLDIIIEQYHLSAQYRISLMLYVMRQQMMMAQ